MPHVAREGVHRLLYIVIPFIDVYQALHGKAVAHIMYTWSFPLTGIPNADLGAKLSESQLGDCGGWPVANSAQEE